MLEIQHHPSDTRTRARFLFLRPQGVVPRGIVALLVLAFVVTGVALAPRGLRAISAGWSTSPRLHYGARLRDPECGSETAVDPRIVIRNANWTDPGVAAGRQPLGAGVALRSAPLPGSREVSA